MSVSRPSYNASLFSGCRKIWIAFHSCHRFWIFDTWTQERTARFSNKFFNLLTKSNTECPSILTRSHSFDHNFFQDSIFLSCPWLLQMTTTASCYYKLLYAANGACFSKTTLGFMLSCSATVSESDGGYRNVWRCISWRRLKPDLGLDAKPVSSIVNLWPNTESVKVKREMVCLTRNRLL